MCKGDCTSEPSRLLIKKFTLKGVFLLVVLSVGTLIFVDYLAAESLLVRDEASACEQRLP
jgi:hypothetical protein